MQCFRRYQTAQILLHSLSQQVYNQSDKKLLMRYKEAVEKRLFVLQSQGLVMAFDNTTAWLLWATVSSLLFLLYSYVDVMVITYEFIWDTNH